LLVLFLSTLAASQLVAAITAEVASQITAPTRPVARQNTGISALWLLSSASDSSQYEPTWCPSGSTITSSASFWGCCTTSGECPWYTTCLGSTAVGPDTREICSTSANCVTEYLYATAGAQSQLTRPHCLPISSTNHDYYVQSPPAATSTTASQPSTTRPAHGNSTNPAGPSRTQSSGDIVTTGSIVAAVVCLAIGIVGAAVIYWSLVIRSTAGYAPYNDKPGAAELGTAVELDVITAVPQSHTAPHAGADEAPGGGPAPGNRA